MPRINRTVAEYQPGHGPRSHPNCPSHLIPVVPLHLQAHDHHVMDPAPAVYPIRIRDHLGATAPRPARWIRRSWLAVEWTNLTVRGRTTMTFANLGRARRANLAGQCPAGSNGRVLTA